MRINILEYLEETAARVPDKLAFSDGNAGLTFRELLDAARSVGTALLQKGAAREPVLVRMGKRPETTAAYFGVLYAGCYYVPVDDDMPRVRIDCIIEMMQPRFILTEELFSELCGIVPDDTLLLEARNRAVDTDPVYTVFTSGSTGVPKGVAASHRSVIDYAESLCDTLGFDCSTVFGNQAPLSIDACLKELIPVIKLGATAYLIPKGLFMFPLKLTAFLNEHKINTLCWVASALTLVSSTGALEQEPPLYLRTVAFGGEVFPHKQLSLWRNTLPDVRFFNLYGPTEATGMSCWYEVPRDVPDPLPVGRPFRNTGVFLLGENGEAVPQGGIGEICIRGAGLTLGYWGDVEKTAQSFIQNPLNKAYYDPVYRTGDLGRFNEAGDLMFMSRRDHQIKHMGHRIELGEIEAAAARIDGLQRACCIYDGKIILFFTGDIPVPELAAQLRSLLPRYMIPGQFIPVDAMPLTPSGKLDRKALAELISK